MTKCLNCCGQSFDGQICPNCGHPAYRRELDEIAEVLSVTINKREYGGYSSVGPLHYQTQGLMSYAINSEWIAKAMCHPTLAVLFCKPDDAPDCDISLVLSDNPLLDFVKFHNYLVTETQFYNNRPTFIHHAAQINKSAAIMEKSSIGARTVVSPQVTIGIDGARFVDGVCVKHAGGVRIGDDCFVGAGSVIVRGVWGNDTRIGNKTFIGNLVNIGHNCVIGNNCVILPGAVLCGSVTVSNGVTIGPRATVRNGVTIGDGAKVSIGSVVTKDVPPGTTVTGNFAIEHGSFIRQLKNGTNLIDDDVVIGNGTRLRDNVELRSGTVIGEDCYIDSGVKSSGKNRIGNHVTLRYDAIVARGCVIGDDCYICPQVMFNNVDHHGKQVGGAHVGNNVFIGTNSTIAAGITIADNTVIGAKALVLKDIVEPGVYVGIPARRIGDV